MDPIDLAEAFSRFRERWQPKRIGHVNDVDVKLARLEGEFVWHTHEAVEVEGR